MRRVQRTHANCAHASRAAALHSEHLDSSADIILFCVLTKPTVCMRHAQRPHYRAQLLSPLRSLPLQVKKKNQGIKKNSKVEQRPPLSNTAPLSASLPTTAGDKQKKLSDKKSQVKQLPLDLAQLLSPHRFLPLQVTKKKVK